MAWISPNQLTIMRMTFVPVLVFCVIYHYFGWALLIFLIAGATDALDGLLARKYDRQTAVGAFLDPMADKLLLSSSFVLLSLPSLDLPTHIPLWLTIPAVSRDILIVTSCVIISIATGYRDFRPAFIGKLNTNFQLLTVLTALASNFSRREWPVFKPLLYLALATTVASGLYYLYVGMRILGRCQSNALR